MSDQDAVPVGSRWRWDWPTDKDLHHGDVCRVTATSVAAGFHVCRMFNETTGVDMGEGWSVGPGAWERLPDQSAAGEVKGSVTFEKGEWYEFNHNGIHYVGRATGVLTGGGEVELDAWKSDSMHFVRYAIGGLPVADCVGGPVPGPDEGKAEALQKAMQDYDKARAAAGKPAPATPRCAPGCTPKEPCRTEGVCPVFREEAIWLDQVSQFGRRGAVLPPYLRRSVALHELGAGPPAPMRTGLGGLACGMVNVEHGVRRR